MSREYVLMMALVIALSGCGAPEKGFVEPTGADATAPTTSAPPPRADLRSVELANSTMRFARTNDARASTLEFRLGTHAETLWLNFTAIPECPLTYYYNPGLRLRAPDSQTQSVQLFKDGTSGPQPRLLGCPFVSNPREPPINTSLEVKSGPWTIEASGECTCTVEVIVSAGIRN
jgi:hypothetical protein